MITTREDFENLVDSIDFEDYLLEKYDFEEGYEEFEEEPITINGEELFFDGYASVKCFEDWEGDPSVPNGTRSFTVCKISSMEITICYYDDEGNEVFTKDVK